MKFFLTKHALLRCKQRLLPNPNEVKNKINMIIKREGTYTKYLMYTPLAIYYCKKMKNNKYLVITATKNITQ